MVYFYSASAALVFASLAVAQQCGEPSGPVKDAISALSNLGDKLDVTSAAVDSFEKSQGISGALKIQTSEADIESAATDVTKKTSALSDLDDCDSKALADAANGAGSKIISLLDALTKKQPDLSSVGTADIVKNDLTSLESKLGEFMTAAYQKSTCAGVDQLAPGFDKLNTAYADAFKAYGGSSSGAVSKPANCRQGGSSGSSNSGGASASGSGVAAGSSAPPAGSTSATSAAPTNASSTTSAAVSSVPTTNAVDTSGSAAASAIPSVAPSNDGSTLSVSSVSTVALVCGLVGTLSVLL